MIDDIKNSLAIIFLIPFLFRVLTPYLFRVLIPYLFRAPALFFIVSGLQECYIHFKTINNF